MNELFDFDFNVAKDERYTNKIGKLQYIPKELSCPSSESLFNIEKYNELVKEINEQNLPSEIKKFLLLSATRFIVFDYSKIAEFYCHQNKNVQELMEKLGLVIIDFDDALENGFVKLQKKLENIYDKSDEL